MSASILSEFDMPLISSGLPALKQHTDWWKAAKPRVFYSNVNEIGQAISFFSILRILL